jgi:Zn-finger nucleic acid-binding protein
MNCTSCKEPMVVLELDQVEIDYCLSCAGIWLDAGELEILLGDAGKARNALEGALSLGKTRPGKRRCPICRKRMDIITAGSGHKVEIDRCRKHHGLWFDREELEEILKILGEGRNEKIIRLLHDMFRSHPMTGKES